MVIGSIISALFFASFAYIMLILANRESGNMKLAGQILAALIALVALFVLVSGPMGWGKMGGCQMMGGGMMGGGSTMGGSSMMMQMMKNNPSMMNEMMKDKDFRMMMQKSMNKTK